MIAAHGFKALKVKGGQGVDTDIAALREIRRAVGDVLIYVDCNRAYAVADAPDYVARLAEQGVALAEDPCPLSPGRAFGELKAKCRLPLLVDGDCRDLASAKIFLESGASALNLKIQKARGFTENRQIAEAAHAAGASADVAFSARVRLARWLRCNWPPRRPRLRFPQRFRGFCSFARSMCASRCA